MIYLFLAQGFEETEAFATADVLRRAGLDVTLAGVGGIEITGAHGITVQADADAESLVPDESLEAVVLPGGMPGTENLRKSRAVNSLIDWAACHGKLVTAICAAPSILGEKGLLAGKKCTAFPGYEEYFTDGEYTGACVEKDGNIITARGAGVSLEFGFAIVSVLCGKSKAEKLKEAMQCAR